METENSTYMEENDGINITVTPFFIKEKSIPTKNIYFYAYQIKIINLRNETYQLIKRNWIIRNGLGKEQKISGDGVVGKSPVLKPGEEFTYTSFCPLPTPTGNMRGSFEFIDTSSTTKLDVKIPLFFLRTPETFH